MDYQKKLNKLIKIGIVLYILVLIWIVYFKFGNIYLVWHNAFSISHLSPLERFMFDIRPFDFSNSPDSQLLSQIFDEFLNGLIFAPFGILLPLLNKKVRILPQLLFCFGLSLIIEVTQYFTAIGGLASDDLIMNTLGYFLGLAIYWLIFKKFPKKAQYITYVIVDILLLIAVVIGIIVTIKYFDQYLILLKKLYAISKI
jgi:glycopeptide antibiotics resistance protein